MPKLVLFDFDGVIIDSMDAALSANRSIFPDITEADYKGAFEENVFEGFRRIREKYTANPGVDFFEQYNKVMLDQRVFDGMADAVRSLSGQYFLYIVSSSQGGSIDAWLVKHDMREYFRGILGSDHHKSKIHKINYLLEELGAEKKDVVFVTDTLGDIREAREVGIGVLAVSWGFHDEELLSKGDPDGIVRDPQDLVRAVGDYFAGFDSGRPS